jgi:hypothetical protein
MNAQEEIKNLMNEYCYAIDSGDFLTFAKLFKNSEWIAEGKKPSKESANNIIIYEDGTPKTKHSITNISIDVDEERNKATAHSYVTVYQGTEEFPLQVIFSGDYFDEFKKTDGAWCFSKREIRNSITGDMCAHLKIPSLTIPSAKDKKIN